MKTLKVIVILIISSFFSFSLCYGQINTEELRKNVMEYAFLGKFDKAKKELLKAPERPIIGFRDRYLKIINYVNQQRVEAEAVIHYFKAEDYFNEKQWDISLLEIEH